MFIICHLIVGECEPLTLERGRIEYSRPPANGMYPGGTRAVHWCNEGYSFFSFWGHVPQPQVRTCQTSGNWGGLHQVCS